MSDTKEKETPIIEEEKLNDQMKVRREKMQEFIDAGVYPFGQKYNWESPCPGSKGPGRNFRKK